MGIVFPYLMGGLGNWLFQVAFATFIGGEENTVLSEKHCSRSPHSSNDYFKTIFRKFPQRDLGNIRCYNVKEPENLNTMDTKSIINALRSDYTKNMFTLGYFQNWSYIPDNFENMLVYQNPSLLVKYPDLSTTCFLHVRGGDYVGHPVHDVGLSVRYYQTSIQFMKDRGITKFTVFTNDHAYCSRQEYLKDIDYRIVDENEIDTLYLMTVCKAGIIANSSFSWWGAYLNRKRPICVPSKWFNTPGMNISGYFFPDCFVQRV